MTNVKFKKEWFPSDLLEFLEAEGVTEKYLNNMNEQNEQGFNEAGENLAKTWFEDTKFDPSYFLSFSFGFMFTKEGYNFWSNLDKKWQEYLNGK